MEGSAHGGTISRCGQALLQYDLVRRLNLKAWVGPMTTIATAWHNRMAHLYLRLVEAAPRFNLGLGNSQNGSGPARAGGQTRDLSHVKQDFIALLFLFGYLLVALLTNLYVLPRTELIYGSVRADAGSFGCCQADT